MKLHCPSCQKELIIEDQYAGQRMKCPMCQTGFTAPALTDFAAQEPAGPAPDAPTAEDMAAASQASKKRSQTPYTGEHSTRLRIPLETKILQWIPVGALFFAGIFTWFTWVWLGTSNRAIISQSGVQIAVGMYGEDADLTTLTTSPAKKIAEDRVGMSGLTLLYLVLLFVGFVVSGAMAALALIPIDLSAFKSLLMWKWVVVTAILLLGVILLLLVSSMGFNLEIQTNRIVSERMDSGIDATTDAKMKKTLILSKEQALDMLHRHWALSFVFWLHVLAFAVAALLFWLDLRQNKNKPVPQIDVLL